MQWAEPLPSVVGDHWEKVPLLCYIVSLTPLCFSALCALSPLWSETYLSARAIYSDLWPVYMSEWVSEGSCTAHSVAHSVTQGSFTWLTSGHKRWHLRKLLIAYRMEDFYKVASSKLKIVTTNGRNNMYLNLELITSNGNVMGLIPSGCMKWILNVKCINVKVEKNGRS